MGRREQRGAKRASAPGPSDAGGADVAYDEVEVGVEPPGSEDLAPVPWEALIRRLRGRPRDEAAEPAPERSPWLVLFVALSGVFATSFTITVLTVSLEDIANDLGTSTSVITWAVTGPILAMAVFGPVAGKYVDRVGARPMFLLSTFMATLMAIGAAAAIGAGALLVFRLVGAVAGAASGPAALALINSRFPPARRAQAMGYWSLTIAGAPVFGVVIGGPLVDSFGWRWIFLLQAPLSAAGFLLGLKFLPDTPRRPRAPFDVLGAATLGGAAASLLFALNRGPEVGWSNPIVVGGLVLFPALLVAFVAAERRTDHPLLPLGYFGRRNFTAPMVQQFCGQFAYMGGFIVTPLLLSDVLGYSTTKVGLVSIVRPGLFSLIGPVAGYLAVRAGERTIGVAGSLMLVASMLGMAVIGSTTGLWWILVMLGLSGLAMGTAGPPMIASIANSVDERDLGVVSAASQTINQVGSASGMQILLTVQASQASSGASSYAWAYLVGAGVAAIAVVAALFVRNSRHEASATVDEPAVAGA